MNCQNNVVKDTQICFPVSGPTSYLKITRPPDFSFFQTPKLKENGVQTAKCIVYPGSQNVEAWVVKTMSADCVNTVVNTDYI